MSVECVQLRDLGEGSPQSSSEGSGDSKSSPSLNSPALEELDLAAGNHDDADSPRSAATPRAPQKERKKRAPRVTVTGRSRRSFGFAKNRFQVVVHWLLAALVGVSLRLASFPQGSLANTLQSGADEFIIGSFNSTTNETLMSSMLVPEEEDRVNHAVHTSFLISFGVTNAVGNFLVGRAADAYGRKMPHVVGWVCGLFVAFILMHARSFEVIVLANMFLGAQQALTWSTNIFMLTDVLGPKKRAVSAALGNFTGILASSFGGFLAAFLMHSGGPEAAFMGVFVTCAVGLLLSMLWLKDTMPFVAVEAASEAMGIAAVRGIKGCDNAVEVEVEVEVPLEDTRMVPMTVDLPPSPHTGKCTVNEQPIHIATWREIAMRTTYDNTSSFVVCLCGTASNMVTGLVWGLVLIWGRERGLSHLQEAAVSSLYYVPNATVVLLSGLLSDRWSVRKPLIMGGLSFLVVGLATSATAGEHALSKDTVWLRLLAGVTLLGSGLGMSHPVLSAAIGDHTPAVERATALGVYRFWRDIGYAAGGLVPTLVFSESDIDHSYVAATLTFAVMIVVCTLSVWVLYTERYPVERKKGGDVMDTAL